MYSRSVLFTQDGVSGLSPAFSQFYSTTETLEVKWLNARSHNESVPPCKPELETRANTCSFALDHPASSFKSISLEKKSGWQILFAAINGGWSDGQEAQLALVIGMQGKPHL